jgi:hypothetical protein
VAREQSDVNYYHACAAEMMMKAQAAPTKAVRDAYLHLALNWVREALFLQTLEDDEGGWNPEADSVHQPARPIKN